MENSSRIYIQNLPPSFTAQEFRQHFSRPVPNTDAKLIQHRRIGYVGYKTPDQAAQAVKYHNKTFIQMSRIAVQIARPIENQRAPRLKENASGRNLVGTTIATGPGTDAQKDPADQSEGQQGANGGGQERESKLQEFLHVMQPTSKNKVWEQQEVLTPKVAPKSGDTVPVPISNAESGEGDSEYEDVPPKRRKVGENSDGPRSQAQEESSQDSQTKPMAAPAMQAIPPLASDADWLRMKMEGVSSLVDDDNTARPKAESAISPRASTVSPEVQHMTGIEQGGEQSEVNETSTVHDSRGQENDAFSLTNNRLFLRNLSYTATEMDVRQHIEGLGVENIVELNLPVDSTTGNNKGFAHVELSDADTASRVLLELDQKPFQGRLLHVLRSHPKKNSDHDEFAILQLPLKKQKLLKHKAAAPSSTFNWNSMYMNSDAIMSSISNRLGLSKSDVLDPTSSDAAVRQALAETHLIQEARAYFAANGVDVDSFRGRERGHRAILVKNFSFTTKVGDIRALFEVYGPLKRLLMPDGGTIAIVEFQDEEHARSAFKGLAYRKVDGSVLFLEKAPRDLFCSGPQSGPAPAPGDQRPSHGAKSTTDYLNADHDPPGEGSGSTLYIRNLNFSSNDARLQDAFRSLEGYMSAHVKTKPDPKRAGQMLSMGYGFVEFRTRQQAQTAEDVMQGYRLDGHDLVVRPSRRTADAAEERKRADEAKRAAGRRTKIIIKNLPFEATKKDVRSLFGAYGQLRSVRTPRKFDGSTRGFAFADFITSREAESAMVALRDTHFLGRKMVLDFAAEDAIDPEVEIAKMQQKVGSQTDKVALQKLTGTGRKRFTVEGAND